jgi:hypothetical protein
MAWEAAVHALLEEEACALGRALALRTGLLLLLRAHVSDATSPAELTAARERSFLARLPKSMRAAGRETLRALQDLVPPARRRARRGR